MGADLFATRFEQQDRRHFLDDLSNGANMHPFFLGEFVAGGAVKCLQRGDIVSVKLGYNRRRIRATFLQLARERIVNLRFVPKHLALRGLEFRHFDRDGATYGWRGWGGGKRERCEDDIRVVTVAEGFGPSKVKPARCGILYDRFGGF